MLVCYLQVGLVSDNLRSIASVSIYVPGRNWRFFSLVGLKLHGTPVSHSRDFFKRPFRYVVDYQLTSGVFNQSVDAMLI